MTDNVGHIKCSSERRPSMLRDALLGSFTLSGAFIASEMNLVTLVVLEPGSQPLLYRVHTEDEIIIFIIKAFTGEHISFVQNDFLSF